ncbi:ribonuclease R [Peptostreptococcus porci]|uniref:ribonuclease R n=1 Tax=Peptostreptococcus porci TaxID=2652282 RepID=UPI002A91452E|nr:ribonuclease R [Peptostreptococcus porci]MDY5435111.1 ribonuclease R [Peptostreptococcus porci]
MLGNDVKNRILGLINETAYKPMPIDELVMIFAEDKIEKSEVKALVQEMFEDGELFINKKGKVGSLKSYSMVKGRYGFTRKTFGFVTSEKDNSDIYIDSDDRNGAFDGDTVLVKITKEPTGRMNKEGVVIKILERANREIVGLFHENNSFGFVIPDNKKFDNDIFIPKKYFSGAKNNDKVVCKIEVWPDDKKKPEGIITEIIGQSGERFVEIDSIVRSHGFQEEFPEKVIAQLEMIENKVKPNEIEGRLDLREKMIYTIDGDDSKDFDDAISVEILDNGNYELGVHIADVTHYVKENSPLDREALRRGTSVYMVDKVIPMLPQKLSNGICSLNPHVDRLTLSCIMEVNPQNAKVVRHVISESVIRSNARLTYHEVSEFLENDDKSLIENIDDPERTEELFDSLRNAGVLSELLRKNRFKRGAIDFDFPESKIVLNKNGYPIDISPYERRVSNKLIEEFMLLANETIAEHFFWLKTPFVYRVHELPDSEKVTILKEYLYELDIMLRISKGGIRPSDLQRVLDSIEDFEIKQAVGSIMLRTLRQARYSPECLGHFGLAATYYCHFTSPIRRYPDLQIHRIIKEQISGKLSDKRITHYENILYGVSDQSSVLERKAEMAERDVDDYYKAVFMSDKVGDEFEGHISGITNFGIFVELSNGVEGMISLESLPDYYIYNERSKTLVGETTKKVYKIGQKHKVKLIKVEVETRKIDFSFIQE